jgi:hypothetical protein
MAPYWRTFGEGLFQSEVADERFDIVVDGALAALVLGPGFIDVLPEYLPTKVLQILLHRLVGFRGDQISGWP